MSIFDIVSGQPAITDSPGPQGVPVDGVNSYHDYSGNQAAGYQMPAPPVGGEAMEPAPAQVDAGMGMEDALIWHNQALVNRLNEAESRLATIRPLENLLQNDPGAYARVLQALQAPPPAEDTSIKGVSGTPAWEANESGPPPAAPQVDTLLRAQADVLQKTLGPVQAQINQIKVDQANVALEKELDRLSRTYGPDFNPREVVAYALSRNTTDLDQAFRWVVGEKTFRQKYAGAANPGPQQAIGGQQVRTGSPQGRTQTPVGYQAPPPPARVEPSRGRMAAPPPGAVPPGYVAKDYSEAASIALNLLRGARP